MKLKNKISKDFKIKFRRWLYVMICIFVFHWSVFSCLEMWLNCAILDVNNQNVYQDVSSGSFTEVAEIYSNGDFVLVDSPEVYTSEDISEYIRVSNDVKYYYNLNNKQFVSKLTLVESRDVMLKFGILDVVNTVMLIVSSAFVFKLGSKKKFRTLKKTCMILLYIVYVLFTQFAYEYAFDVLFNANNLLWVIMLTKAVALLITLIVCKLCQKHKRVKAYKKAKKKCRKLKKKVS